MSNVKFLKFGTSSIGKIGSNVMGYKVYPQAEAFITTANITDENQKSAIRYLVSELVENSLMDKMRFIYPMVGGDATRHSYNLVDTSLYQLSFNGGWNHSSTGALPNGVNAWADTGFLPNVITEDNSVHISYYSRSNTAKGTFEPVMGCVTDISTNSDNLQLRVRTSDNFGGFLSNITPIITTSVTDARGLFLGSVLANNDRYLSKNGTVIGTNTTTSTFQKASDSIYLATINRNGSLLSETRFFTDKECAFSSCGLGLNTSELTTFYNIVQQFQTILGRNV